MDTVVTDLQINRILPIDYTGLPISMWGKVSAVCHSVEEAEDLVNFFGDPCFAPFHPVVLMVPGSQPIQITGQGVASAAELRDLAVGIWEITLERLKKNGRGVLDFDDLRERHGLMRFEDVKAKMSEAFMDRIARHKASPVTDPVRQMDYPRPNERTLHTVADSQDWKAAND